MADYFPPASFYFKVFFKIEGARINSETSFQEVSGLTVDSSPEEVPEGGLLQYSHKLPTTPKYSNLVLKRGLLTDSKVRTWIEDGINKFKFSPAIVTIALLNQFAGEKANAQTLMTWTVYNAWPVKWEVSNFNSQGNELVIESIELAYNYFEAKKRAG
jgi:phage tail-like protein